MWQRWKAVIRGDEKSTKARKRRHKELAWTTVLNEYRKRGRASNDQSHEEDSVDNNSNDSVGSGEWVALCDRQRTKMSQMSKFLHSFTTCDVEQVQEDSHHPKKEK